MDATNVDIKLENNPVTEDSRSEGKHVCTKCRKQFTWKKNLNRHMNLHLGRFKFYCDECKKGFVDSRDYKVHMDKHAGIMYKCSKCTMSFNSEKGRDLHMSAHTGIYRLTCNMCGKGFNRKDRYEKHCNVHR